VLRSLNSSRQHGTNEANQVFACILDNDSCIRDRAPLPDLAHCVVVLMQEVDHSDPHPRTHKSCSR
jgi:hypothetical protein